MPEQSLEYDDATNQPSLDPETIYRRILQRLIKKQRATRGRMSAERQTAANQKLYRSTSKVGSSGPPTPSLESVNNNSLNLFGQFDYKVSTGSKGEEMKKSELRRMIRSMIKEATTPLKKGLPGRTRPPWRYTGSGPGPGARTTGLQPPSRSVTGHNEKLAPSRSLRAGGHSSWPPPEWGPDWASIPFAPNWPEEGGGEHAEALDILFNQPPRGVWLQLPDGSWVILYYDTRTGGWYYKCDSGNCDEFIDSVSECGRDLECWKRFVLSLLRKCMGRGNTNAHCLPPADGAGGDDFIDEI